MSIAMRAVVSVALWTYPEPMTGRESSLCLGLLTMEFMLVSLLLIAATEGFLEKQIEQKYLAVPFRISSL